MSKQQHTTSTKTAKLSQSLFFKLGNGEIDISANAIDFMFYTINFVAKDGRIYCNIEKVRTFLFMQQQTLDRVIDELKSLGFISEQEGYLYSHFHVLSNGDKEDKGYIRNIKALTSDYVRSLNKKKKRFLLYIISFARMGVPKAVSVEALYNNMYHSGVNYIDGYQELSEFLFEFVQRGYLVVYINKKRFDYTSHKFEEAFHDFCNFDVKTGKKRMSKKKEHKIALQIHEDLLKKDQVVPNNSSETEFRLFADKYNIYHELLRAETIPFFISVQNQLYDTFGKTGLYLYRNALDSYFSKEEENVLYHDLLKNEKETKAVNYMMDFHLIKDVQSIIVKALTSTDESEAVEISGYVIDKEKVDNLIGYFADKSSDNQKILFHAELENNNIQMEELIGRNPEQNEYSNHWYSLNNRITETYERFDFDIDDEILSNEQQKEIIQKWAYDGLLVKEEELKEAVNQLKKKVQFIPKSKMKIKQHYAKKDINNDMLALEESMMSRQVKEREQRLKDKGFLDNLRELNFDY
ncbi:hypothetical protein [Oceanobacillus sp. CF4.6]|uniref:hypothetical protein n=1 Tax=Oceanobacillus sp. CF4.6 TaxID=3373080 RepID=UPI003EE72E86